jgi:hypothetical protein
VKTDKQLQRDVIDELQYDLSVDASKIGLSFTAGSLAFPVPWQVTLNNAARQVLLKGLLGSRRLSTKPR